MDNATIYVDGETINPGAYNYEMGRVQVAINENGDMAQHRCKHCGATLTYDVYGNFRNDDGDVWATECPDAEEGEEGGFGPHEAEPVPLAWCNSASIALDEDDDAVSVSISTGDPRGGFTFTVRRRPDGSLIMHTPYPGEPAPHETLTEDHPGTYRIR